MALAAAAGRGVCVWRGQRQVSARGRCVTALAAFRHRAAAPELAPAVLGAAAAALVAGGCCAGGAQAAASATAAFDGDWVDTNHPGCMRRIENGVLSGEDPVPFVPAKGDGKPGSPCVPGGERKPWSIKLSQVDNEAGTVYIDFDQKDGSGEAFLAKLEGGGLRINDTTLWPRKQ